MYKKLSKKQTKIEVEPVVLCDKWPFKKASYTMEGFADTLVTTST